MFGNDADVEVKEVPMDVDFGTADHEKMTHFWACKGMTWLHSERPLVFGDMMLAITGVEKRSRGK